MSSHLVVIGPRSTSPRGADHRLSHNASCPQPAAAITSFSSSSNIHERCFVSLQCDSEPSEDDRVSTIELFVGDTCLHVCVCLFLLHPGYQMTRNGVDKRRFFCQLY